MKKKCMAVGGTAKKPATMEEQLAGIRGKVRPGYQAGGIAGQVDDLMNRTKAMPNSIASAPQPYGGSVIPAQTGQQAMQSATNFGMPPAGTAPASSSQTISTGDYSTGPKETGFIFSDGTRRDGLTQEQAKQLESQQAMQRAQQSANAPTPQAAAPLMTMAEKESSLGLNPNRTYTPGSAMDPLASGGGISQALKVANPSPSLPNVAVAQIPQIEPVGRNRQRNRGFADGGILDKLIRTVGKILPESNGQKYEPGIQSRAAEDPARHGRAEALNPRTQTAPSETLPAGGFQEEAARRRKQMEEAMNYEAGGMVRFAGKGGPRDDQIPVKVAGEEINVSNGENAVILPAKTAANPAALYAIGGIIQATNDGRKPKMGMEKSDYYARGGMVGGNLSSSGAYVNEDDISGVENLKRAMATYAKPFQAVGQVFADSARAQQEGVSYQDILARDAAQNQDPVRARHNSILAGQGTSGTVDLPITERDKQAAIASTAAAKQGITAGIAQPSGAVVNDGMTTTQMGRGFDPTKLQMAPGYGMASNAAGKTISVGPSEYVGADGKPTSRWTDTQQYKDAIARNQADKLRLAELQSQRLGADPMAVQKASQGIAQSVMQAPLDARVKQQQIQQGDVAAQNANELRALYEAHKTAKTPEERSLYEEAIRVRTGKDNKLLAVDLGSDKVTDEMGNVKGIPRGQGVINQTTGQWVPQPGTAPKTSFSKAEVDSAIKAGASKEAVAARIKSMGMNPKDYGL
jgi:hypothetical protein